MTKRAVKSLTSLRNDLRQFAIERDWEKFHSPKNLAMALTVEAAELLEHFQWLTDDHAGVLTGKRKVQVREELADVLIYLVRLADKLEVDLLAAASDKVAANAEKYPISKAKGNSRKYTEF